MLALDEPLRQLGRIRKEKIFHLLFTLTALLCGALLKKKKQILGLKGLIGVRAGGVRGAAAPTNFGQLRIFWAARENLGKASF